jgi:SAM-dependent methyltransferase
MRELKKFILQFDQRRKFFRSLSTISELLDIGCGVGKNASELHVLYPSLQIHGIDIIDRSAVPDFMRYTQLNFEGKPLPYADSSFDAIVLAHVLEHLDHPLLLGPELCRVLRPGGVLYVETPNWTSVLIPSFGRKRNQFQTLNFYDDHTHRKPWSKQGIYEYLTLCCGLSVENVGTVRNWLRMPFDVLLVLWCALFPHRGVMASAIWNLTGWRIYGIGRKPTEAEKKT